MLGPLRFRHRIGLLVALAAAALVIVTAVAVVLGRRGEQQLAGIQNRYLPLIELDRDLRVLFAQIPHALQEAASAAEDSKLQEADAVHARMVQRLRAGRQAITDNGGDPQAVERELGTYYSNARAVAAALVAGSSAADVDAQIAAMDRASVAAGDRLDAATAPDRRALAAAFAAARASQRDAIWIDFAVAITALLVIGVLSRRLIRHTVGSLQRVAVGVERLARGEFGHEIVVTSRDELGDVAREANQTAARLREYRDQAQLQAAELRDAYATVEARNATLVAAQQLLEERAADLARASRYKSEFLANMSHELRTPLNSIMVLSEVLGENRDGGMADKELEFARLIHRSGEELLALINEALDLAKIEAGKQAIVCAQVRLVEIQDYLRRMFGPLAAQRELAFEVEAGADLPVAIRTDWTRLAQILKNLIANAFKFTEQGRVAVRVSRGLPEGWRSDVEVVDPLAFAVTDTGIGIAADKQAGIFEAFAQVETGIGRKFGGTGLGLTIAKQLARRLGGDLAVHSALGAGSTFAVVLPIGGPPPSEGAQARSASASRPPPLDDRTRRTTGSPMTTSGPEPVLDGKAVLVVDDDMRNLYSLASALRTRRLNVITAADGEEALEEIERGPELHAVLIDVVMPRMDGLEAIRRIRAHDQFRALPIIAITAKTAAGDRETCLAAGATEYLAKPLDLGALLALLARLA